MAGNDFAMARASRSASFGLLAGLVYMYINRQLCLTMDLRQP